MQALCSGGCKNNYYYNNMMNNNFQSDWLDAVRLLRGCRYCSW